MVSHGSSLQVQAQVLQARRPQTNNLLVFDWDDTLCPSSWLQEIELTPVASARAAFFRGRPAFFRLLQTLGSTGAQNGVVQGSSRGLELDVSTSGSV